MEKYRDGWMLSEVETVLYAWHLGLVNMGLSREEALKAMDRELSPYVNLPGFKNQEFRQYLLGRV